MEISPNLLLEMSNISLLIFLTPILFFGLPYIYDRIWTARYERWPDWLHLACGGLLTLVGLFERSAAIGGWRLLGGAVFGRAQEIATILGTVIISAGCLWMLAALTHYSWGHRIWASTLTLVAIYVGISLGLRS